MADRSPDYLRGFLVPKKITTDNIWSAQSSFTQQNNLSGDPDPRQTNSRLIVKSIGNQTINSDIDVITRRAGHVGAGAAFTYKNNTTNDEFGLDSPNAISNFEVIGYHTGSGIYTTNYKYPYALDIGSGELLVAIQSTQTLRSIIAKKRDIDGNYTSVTIKNIGAPAPMTQDNYPVLIKLSDDSILCFFGVEDVPNELYNVNVYRSTDNGSNWAQISRAALNSSISLDSSTGYTIKRLRAAHVNGQILLLIETVYNDAGASKRNRLHQYASIDGGASFTRVTAENRIDDYNFFQIDLNVRHGEFVLTYIAATNKCHYMVISQAFFDIHLLRGASQFNIVSDDTVAGGSSALLTDGQQSAFIDYSGDIVVYLLDCSTTDNIFSRISVDGANWQWSNGNTSRANAQLYNVDDTATIPNNIHVSRYAGGAVMVNNWIVTSTADDSATAFFLGGFANVNLPVQSFGNSDGIANRAGYNFTYVPMDLPANIAAITRTSTSTEAISNGVLDITTTPLQTLSYKIEDTTTIKLIVTGRIVLETISGGDLGTPFADGVRKIRITAGNGSKSYDVEIRISSTAFRVYDNNATAVIGSDKTIAGVDGVELIYTIGINDAGSGRFACWYRQHNDSQNRNYQTGPAGSLSDGGSTTATMQVFFVHIPATSSTNVQTKIMQWVNGFDTIAGGKNLAGLTDFVSPYDLAAALYPPNGSFRYVADGVSITTANGPAFEGDQYQIKTRYQYPIDNVFYDVSPTPRVQYRSAAVTSGAVPEVFLPFALDSTSTASNVQTDSDVIAIHLSNINFRQFTIEYYDVSGGSWTVAKTVNTSINLEFNYEVNGNTITGIDGSDEPYLFYNEFADCVVELTIGGSVERYRIVSHTEGKTSTISYRRPVFTLTGRPSGNGTARILPKNVTTIINLRGQKATAWAIRIQSNVNIDNQYKIGLLCIGSVLYAGRQYSWGRTIQIESNVETYEAPDYTTYYRKMSPSRRRVAVAWSEGVDISSLMGANPTPDIITASTSAGAQPIATVDDVPFLIFGLLDYLSGGTPVVYLPSVKRATTTGEDTIIINRYHDQILATIDPEASIDNVVGDEGISDGGELFRVANINMVERV